MYNKILFQALYMLLFFYFKILYMSGLGLGLVKQCGCDTYVFWSRLQYAHCFFTQCQIYIYRLCYKIMNLCISLKPKVLMRFFDKIYKDTICDIILLLPWLIQ